MKLIAAGRASEIFDLGNGRVLRRFKSGGDPGREALVMRHARRHGYPVPRVLDVTADALVLEQIEGRTMVDDLHRRVWMLLRHASLLAQLHRRLHEITAPAGLPPVSSGDRLLHLDLHPDNVILTARGPFVIDWPNAARGPGAADVAHSWIVIACSTPTTGLYRRALSAAGRGLLLRAFLRRFDRAELERHLISAGEYRLANRGLPESELTAIRALITPRRGSP
jgi:aminoglycoside phosphotransferase (APT) family kinase protein